MENLLPEQAPVTVNDGSWNRELSTDFLRAFIDSRHAIVEDIELDVDMVL